MFQFRRWHDENDGQRDGNMPDGMDVEIILFRFQEGETYQANDRE